MFPSLTPTNGGRGVTVTMSLFDSVADSQKIRIHRVNPNGWTPSSWQRFQFFSMFPPKISVAGLAAETFFSTERLSSESFKTDRISLK